MSYNTFHIFPLQCVRSLGFGSSNVPFCNSHLYLSPSKWQLSKLEPRPTLLDVFIFYVFQPMAHLRQNLQIEVPLKTSQDFAHPFLWRDDPGIWERHLCRELDFVTFLQVSSKISLLSASVYSNITNQSRTAILFSESELRIHPIECFGAHFQHQGWPWQLSCLEGVHTHQPHRSTPGWQDIDPWISSKSDSEHGRRVFHSFSKPPGSSKLVEPVNTLGRPVWPFDGSVVTLNVFCPSGL